MRIVQVLLSKRIGGAESIAATLESEWAQAMIDCSIVYLDEGDARQDPVSRVRRLRKILRRVNADVIVAHSALPAVYARICAPVGSRVYSVLHSASDDFEDRKLNAAERVLRLRTSAVIAVSTAQAGMYRSRFGDAVPIHVVPNGISHVFRPRRDRAVAPRMIVEVARVVPQKRPDVWLAAMADVLGAHPELDAGWWGPNSGDNEFDEDLAVAASAVGLGHVFRGPTETPESVYDRGDILAHAATREAHSVGLLEAAAMGLTVVCSASVARSLPTDFPVVTFRDEDAGDMAERVGDVIAQWETHSRRAAAYAGQIAETYSAEKCARQYLRIFESDMFVRKRDER